MSILVDRDTRVLVQGITGREGLFHSEQMLAYGTKVVAGVTPGKGGEWVAGGKVPVFDTVKSAVEMTGANCSVIFVPARFAPDAMYEAADAGIPLLVCITEGIPVLDMMRVCSFLDRTGVRLIGPNCPGLLTPGECKAGIIPGPIAVPGRVGVVSRSGTLTYEVLYALKQRGMGASTCVGIGGDPVNGTDFKTVLQAFEQDDDTDVVVMIGEIGGQQEVEAARWAAQYMSKPLVAFIAGASAPRGRRMGHAGAVIAGDADTATAKLDAIEALGHRVVRNPADIGDTVMRAVKEIGDRGPSQAS